MSSANTCPSCGAFCLNLKKHVCADETQDTNLSSPRTHMPPPPVPAPGVVQALTATSATTAPQTVTERVALPAMRGGISLSAFAGLPPGGRIYANDPQNAIQGVQSACVTVCYSSDLLCSISGLLGSSRVHFGSTA